ncbi:hypothetical protein ANO11243_055150 [Dothideomycetidae sp. 11243]|nr:hypothetical protein ANO11243_055150 [fungal sp. No.11243]
MAKTTSQKTANGTKANAVSKSKSAKTSIKPPLSQEIVVESTDDDDASGSEDESSSKEGGTSSDSEEGSSSEESAEKGASASAKASGDSDAEDSDEEDSTASSTDPSSSSEDEDEIESPPRVSPQPETAPPPKEVKRTEYAPPSGYTKIESFSSLADLDLSSLGSKELWHISVPSGVSLSDLTTVPRDGLQSQAVVLSHNGTDYTFAQDGHSGSSQTNKTLILPSTTEKSYKSSDLKISRSIRLQPKLSLPTLPRSTAETATSTDTTTAATTRLAVSAIRPQPKGLRMRYRPPGFGAGRTGTIGSDSSGEDSDTSMDDAPPAQAAFKLPSSTIDAEPSSTLAKKRKRDETKITTPAPAAKDKSKSKTKAVAKAPVAAATETVDDEADDDEEADHVETPKKLTKAEREAKRQRKAERALKRQRKEEKERAKQKS